MKSPRADHIIDYTQEDFTQIGQVYDVLFDTAGKTSIFAQQKITDAQWKVSFGHISVGYALSIVMAFENEQPTI